MNRQPRTAGWRARRLPWFAAAFAGLLLAGGPAPAATLLYWDADGDATTATGGTGNWDTNSLTWRVGSASGALTNWFDGAAPRFRGTAGTVTLVTNVAVDGANGQSEGSGGVGGGIYFKTSGYTVVAGGGTLTIAANNDRPFYANNTVTIAAPLHVALNNTVYFEGNSLVTLSGTISCGGTSTKVAGWNGTLVLGGSNAFNNAGNGNGGYNYSLVVNHSHALGPAGTLRWDAPNSVAAGPAAPVMGNAAGFGNDQMAVFSGANNMGVGASIYQSLNKTPTACSGMNVQNAAATLTFASLTEMTGGGVLTWDGWFTKLGSGTLKIAGNYSCGGITTVSNGTMVINGSTYNADSPNKGQKGYIVASGATLGGTGTVWLLAGSNITVNSGGALAPGSAASNSIGTLTVTGNVTLAEGALYKWEFQDGTGDLVRVNGTLALPNVATVLMSQVSGDWPTKSTPIFTFDAQSGATDLSGWVVQFKPKFRAEIQGNNVVLRPSGWGTIIMVK